MRQQAVEVVLPVAIQERSGSVGAFHLPQFERVADIDELLPDALVFDEHPRLGRAGGLLADFQHLPQVFAEFDLLPELRMLRELVRQGLVEQMFQRLAEVGSHGPLQYQRRKQRLEVRLGHVIGRVQRARSRLGANGVRCFNGLQEPLRQRTLLILEQQPSGLPIFERQMLGMLFEVISQQQPVDDHEFGQFPLSAGREERGEPDERPLPFVLFLELVQPVQVFDR